MKYYYHVVGIKGRGSLEGTLQKSREVLQSSGYWTAFSEQHCFFNVFLRLILFASYYFQTSCGHLYAS